MYGMCFACSTNRPARDDEVPTLTRVKANSEPAITRVPSTTTTSTTRRVENPIIERVAGGVDLPLEQNVQVKKVGGKYRLTDTAKPTTSASTIEVEVPGSNPVDEEDAFSKRRRPISSSRSSYLSSGGGGDSDSDNSQNEKVRVYTCAQRILCGYSYV